MAIPNFREMSGEELMAFWSKHSRVSRKDAEALVGDRRIGYTNVAECLASYACNLSIVLQCREEGDANGASVYGHACGLCLGRLPPDVREAFDVAQGGRVPPHVLPEKAAK